MSQPQPFSPEKWANINNSRQRFDYMSTDPYFASRMKSRFELDLDYVGQGEPVFILGEMWPGGWPCGNCLRYFWRRRKQDYEPSPDVVEAYDAQKWRRNGGGD